MSAALLCDRAGCGQVAGPDGWDRWVAVSLVAVDEDDEPAVEHFCSQACAADRLQTGPALAR